MTLLALVAIPACFSSSCAALYMSVNDPAACNGAGSMTAALAAHQPHHGLYLKKAQRNVLLLGGLLLLALVAAASFAARALPPLKEEDLAVLRTFPPRTLPDLAVQRDVLRGYAATSPNAVLAGYCGTYLLMQTFAIPGTIMLSLLAGGLYGVWHGSILVAAVSTLGSCSCYCLSAALGQPLVHALWPERLDKYAAEVSGRRQELFNYIVFLRVTPILPNTFINVASPIVGVPLLPFALGTLVGCLPNNFVAVNAGSHLGDFTSLSGLYSGRLLALGAAVGVVALAPTLLKQRYALQAAGAAAGAAKAGKMA